MKILIAEDDPDLRENLQLLLELEGYEVFCASNGREAYTLACRCRPDLVLTDIMMPEVDGYGLVKALREDTATATVPIIILSAKADRNDLRTGMNVGADDYLTKPYLREELLEAVVARLARSDSQHKAAQRLQNQVLQARQFDSLTSLPGRELFDQQLAAAVDVNMQKQTVVAVICLGLDGFSKINDSLGSAVGDQVLREVGERLFKHISERMHVDAHDAVARIGADVFAVCLTGGFDQQYVREKAEMLSQLVAKPYEFDNGTLFLSACVGASLCPSQASSAPELLLNAESALHHAKANGPGSVCMFDPAMNQRVARHLQIHNELHQALQQGDLQVFYQPQVNITTGKLVGFEALLRWNHRSLGWIAPNEFIAIAEESGFINQLGRWVMHTAAAQAAQWLAQGHHDFCMAVNLSVRQFMGDNLPELVQQVLKQTGLPAHMLELEVTESLAMQNLDSTLTTLHACKALGVKLAMDDFGTGYSSLAYLKRYPLDALKIDQAFVRNITQDAGDAAITRAIVAMAHSFGLTVIAEGVENTEQLDFLRTLGCEHFQGYLFSHPVVPEQAIKCFSGYQGQGHLFGPHH